MFRLARVDFFFSFFPMQFHTVRFFYLFNLLIKHFISNSSSECLIIIKNKFNKITLYY